MKKSSKIIISAAAAVAVIGIGAVSYAAWSGSGSSAASASGATGQVNLIGGIIVNTDDGKYKSGTDDVIQMQTLYPVDHEGDGLKYWTFELDAEVIGDIDVLYTVKGGLVDGENALPQSVGELYWSHDPITDSYPAGEPIDTIGANIYVADGSTKTTVYVYMVANSVAAMNADISLSFEAAPFAVDNMAWRQADGLTCSGDDVKKYELGKSDNWIISYDLYGVGADVNTWYFGAYVGGEQKIVGIEFANWGKYFASYGRPWDKKYNCPDQVLSPSVISALQSATESDPANVIFMRDGNRIKAFIKTSSGYELVGVADHDMFKTGGNEFGLAERKNFPLPKYKSVKYMSGADSVALFDKTLGGLTVTTGEKTTVDKPSYLLGDKVTLSAAAPPEGKLFAYFTANGVRFDGNTYDIKSDVHFAAVYTDITTVELGAGVKLRSGETGTASVARQTTVSLAHVIGSAPVGQRFESFVVNGEPITGNTFVATDEKYEVSVSYVNKDASDGVALNDISVAADGSSFVRDPRNSEWSQYTAVYDTSIRYDGSDGAVDEDGLLKVTVVGSECSIAIKDDRFTENLDKYKEFYFYVYTEAEDAFAGGRWCCDTDLVPYSWTKITFTREDFPIKITDTADAGKLETSVWKTGLSEFAYRLSGKHIIGNVVGDIDNCVFYLTGIYGVPIDAA